MKKKFGIIGFGGMGFWHAKSILGMDGFKVSDVVELAGIYDIDPKRAEFAESMGIHAYSSLDDILSDKEVEAVVIATPNNFHEPIAIAAMNAGKNVISEKPVTMSVESLDRMIKVANDNGVIFSVHQNRRFDNYFLGMKEIADNGEIGDIISIESRIFSDHGVPGDWRKTVEAGGGMLYDWGVHMLDQQLWMLGYDVEKVYATFDYLTGVPVDDGCYVDVYLKSGKRLRTEICTYNFDFRGLPIMYMRGRTGTATFPFWCEPIKITKCTDWSDTDDILPIKIGSGLSKTIAPRNERTIEKYEKPLPEMDTHNYYRNFCKAIDGVEEQLVKHSEMRVVMQVIEAAFKSAKEGKVIYFD